jgi:predicted regulator of Ras-like GTPase activity (Roadblock/LC7/MglB family)
VRSEWLSAARRDRVFIGAGDFMFADFLDGLMQKVDGALGAAVMGMDGISIEKRLTDPSINIESLAAEYTSSVRTLSSTAQEAGLGALEEFVVSTDHRTVAIRMITPEYYLFALLRKDANLGRARYELKRGYYLLAKEFAI